MSALRNVAQGFRNLWGAADEDEYDPDSYDERVASHPEQPEAREREAAREPQPERAASPASERPERAASAPSYATESPLGGSSGGRRLRSVSIPLRASLQKNIYTLKPKSLDESAVAADYLKDGCAVVINLEEVEQATSIRIIDFMSGVCYGLESQGHAMKLGDRIFLFTPGDFALSSDEVDYAENRDLIFKDGLLGAPQAAPKPAPVPTAAPSAAPAGVPGGAERSSWER